MRLLGFLTLSFLGAVVGCYIGFFVCVSVLASKVLPTPSTGFQEDIKYSEGMTKINPDYTVQKAKGVQSTVGIE